MFSRLDRHRIGGGRHAVTLVVCATLGAVVALSTAPSASHQTQPLAQDTQVRQRLLDLHRVTVSSLRSAAREGAPAEDIERALAEARRGLEALADAKGAAIPDALRKELRTAAPTLANLAGASPPTITSAVEP